MTTSSITAERAWNALRAHYGSVAKGGTVQSGLLTWSMLPTSYQQAFVAAIAELVQPTKETP